MDSPSENRATPHNDLRAIIVAAREAAMRRARRYGSEVVNLVDAVDAATERPDATVEVDTERALIKDREGVYGAVEVASVPATMEASRHVLNPEAASSRVAFVKAGDGEGRELGEIDHADKLLAFNGVSIVEGDASGSCGPAIGSSLRGRDAEASNWGSTGTQRKATDGLSHGENMHGKSVSVKHYTAAGAAVGTSFAEKDYDAGDVTAM